MIHYHLKILIFNIETKEICLLIFQEGTHFFTNYIPRMSWIYLNIKDVDITLSAAFCIIIPFQTCEECVCGNDLDFRPLFEMNKVIYSYVYKWEMHYKCKKISIEAVFNNLWKTFFFITNVVNNKGRNSICNYNITFIIFLTKCQIKTWGTKYIFIVSWY